MSEAAQHVLPVLRRALRASASGLHHVTRRFVHADISCQDVCCVVCRITGHAVCFAAPIASTSAFLFRISARRRPW